MYGKALIASPRAPVLLLLPALAVCLLPGPVLLGLWESLTYYHTFGAIEAPLSFLIAPRANIGGQGYAVLEAIRPLIATLGLPLTLSTFRIPAITCSLLSLVLFFIVARRAFGAWPALGATALLAANPLFFQAGHMMSVLVVSGAALLFLIERLQALETRYWDTKTWVGTGFAAALVALHYGPGRIFAVALVGLWFLRAFWMWRSVPGAAPTIRGILRLGGCAALSCLIVLGVLDPRNLLSIAQFPNFLFPRDSDIAILQYAPGESGIADVATMLRVNLRIALESFAGWTGGYHSASSSYIYSDFRYPLLTPVVAAIAGLGLLAACVRWRRRGPVLATPWASTLVMLGVFSLPVLFSLVMIGPEGGVSSLSIYRLYFCLIPLHLLVAAALHFIGERRPRLAGGVGVAIAALFGALVLDLVAERDQFANRVFAPGWEQSGPATAGRWDDGAPNRDRRSYDFTTHLQQHAQYANVARQLAQRLSGSATSARRIVYVDVSHFTEAPLKPGGLHYIAGRNYHAAFLSLYAGEAGLRVDPVVMVDAARRPIRPDLLAGLAYRGKHREYSALLEQEPDGRIAYARSAQLTPVAVSHGSGAVADILATTPEEEDGARRLLQARGERLQIIRY